MSKTLKLISEQAMLSGMYDILNNVLVCGTPEYIKARKLIDEKWKVIEELKNEIEQDTKHN